MPIPTVLPSAVFSFLSQSLYPLVCQRSRISLQTSAALGPVTPLTCAGPGCLLPLPRLPRPGSLTAGAERLASEHHFLSGALPPARCSGKLFISHKESSKDRICGTLSVWAQMSASLAAASCPAAPHLPEVFFFLPRGPLLAVCRRRAGTQRGGRSCCTASPGALTLLGRQPLRALPTTI